MPGRVQRKGTIMDLENFTQTLDESIDVLEAADCLEDVDFIKKQARFINVLISQAIKQYDRLLHDAE